MADFGYTGILWVPYWTYLGSPGFNSFDIDGATDAIEFIFQAREAATITHLGFRYTLRTGTPVQHKISLQGVGTTGNPDGTILGGGSPASGLFTPPASTAWNATWQWVALDNSIAVTRGQMLSMVIAPVGTPDSSNKGNFAVNYGFSISPGVPYVIQNNATVRARVAAWPVFGYKSSTKTYGYPISAFTTGTTFSNNSTPDERGMRFIIGAGLTGTYQIGGFRWFASWVGSAAKSVTFALYDGTTLLQDVTLDTDYNQAADGTTRIGEVLFDEATLATLTLGNAYRISVLPVGTSVNVGLITFTVGSNADLSAYPGGIECYESTRTDAGAWTDNTTIRPMIELIITDISPAAAGGLMTHPGMAGGARG